MRIHLGTLGTPTVLLRIEIDDPKLTTMARELKCWRLGSRCRSGAVLHRLKRSTNADGCSMLTILHTGLAHIGREQVCSASNSASASIRLHSPRQLVSDVVTPLYSMHVAARESEGEYFCGIGTRIGQ
jgi:hypothetical protein